MTFNNAAMTEKATTFAHEVHQLAVGRGFSIDDFITCLGVALQAALISRKDPRTAKAYLAAIAGDVERTLSEGGHVITAEDDRRALAFSAIHKALQQATGEADKQINILFAIIFGICKTDEHAGNRIHLHIDQFMRSLYNVTEEEHHANVNVGHA